MVAAMMPAAWLWSIGALPLNAAVTQWACHNRAVTGE